MTVKGRKPTGKLAKSGKTVVTLISKIQERQRTRKACLVMLHGPEVGRRYMIDRGALTIGRSSACDIQLSMESVSRTHAKIVVRDKQVFLRDLGSTNGTYVNGRKIAQATIVREGDKIYIVKFRRRKSSHTKVGHRQRYLRVSVESIEG